MLDSESSQSAQRQGEGRRETGGQEAILCGEIVVDDLVLFCLLFSVSERVFSGPTGLGERGEAGGVRLV